ncbi:helix-turn-helix transcriptional regulator [Actinoplanes sp. N902-109]|uniref:helix-turn-helix domain-containing protein n=1 Tax=Actinoplanes sp. (strain N902-109) TaxID=649831 RepID=UPI0003294BA3|nr:helix-turn-helix transcriptional regulator [Actinoplanes sp. N902-109]AGL13843.1 hypothetical protein L083_0333 [Actinoplanes sp. N902-109]
METPVTVTETDRLIAGAVRAEIARSRIRQRELMEETGWKRSYLTRRLSATVPFSVSELITLARILGVDVVSLIPDEARGYAAPGLALAS